MVDSMEKDWYQALMHIMQENESAVWISLAAIFLAALFYLWFRIVIYRWIQSRLQISASVLKDGIRKNNPFHKIALVAPLLGGVMLLNYAGGELKSTGEILATVLIVLLAAGVTDDILDILHFCYQKTQSATRVPIKGYIQVLKLLIYGAAFLLIVSVVLNRSPLVVLSGMGALAAVLLLIFKDTILSFVASIQLAINDMIRIGDWIEMPGYNADGDVLDIALHTVKVQNWDKTITMIPTNRFVQESFKNWRGMQLSGGRRICRSIVIDVNSVSFLDEQLLEKLKKIHVLRDHLSSVLSEIEKYNASVGVVDESAVNGRKLTNLGQFRVYVESYLQNHKGIHKDMTLMVRQLEAGPQGIPLQIYCFTNTVNWQAYELIQSDIFDHLFAILDYFSLQAYQNPSGRDLACFSRYGFRDGQKE
jgi:miniconductance mechanosensitive channel